MLCPSSAIVVAVAVSTIAGSVCVVSSNIRLLIGPKFIKIIILMIMMIMISLIIILMKYDV